MISVFSSSKCRLFHNATFFGSCIIHILNTGVLKFKCKIPAPKSSDFPAKSHADIQCITERNFAAYRLIIYPVVYESADKHREATRLLGRDVL